MYKIHTKQIVTDIRSGMGDEELMAKYGLPPKLFQRLLQRLVSEEAIAHQDLYEISATYRNIADVLISRRHPRVYVPTAIRVYEDGTSQRGFIRDISENGVRVAGIEAKVGQTMTLSMPLREVPGIGPVRFEAVCRWSERKGEHKRYAVSGFEMTTMSEEGRDRLLQLVEFFRLQTGNGEEESTVGLKTTQLVRSMPEMKPPSKSVEFSGTIEGVDILDLVHFIILNGHTTVLDVRSSEGQHCRLHLSNGKIVHANGGNLEGREALFSCMSFPGGSFSTCPWQEPVRCTISEPADFLLVEAARRRDEFYQQHELRYTEDHLA